MNFKYQFGKKMYRLHVLYEYNISGEKGYKAKDTVNKRPKTAKTSHHIHATVLM